MNPYKPHGWHYRMFQRVEHRLEIEPPSQELWILHRLSPVELAILIRQEANELSRRAA